MTALRERQITAPFAHPSPAADPVAAKIHQNTQELKDPAVSTQEWRWQAGPRSQEPRVPQHTSGLEDHEDHADHADHAALETGKPTPLGLCHVQAHGSDLPACLMSSPPRPLKINEDTQS